MFYTCSITVPYRNHYFSCLCRLSILIIIPSGLIEFIKAIIQSGTIHLKPVNNKLFYKSEYALKKIVGVKT